jgi:hypothetical protein
MYPTALTPEEFEQENSKLAKLKIALQHITYSKPRDTYLAKEFIGFQFDPKLELFIENLAMRIDELAGTDSERMKYELEKLWIEVHIETELEYANTQPKHSTIIDLPWLD